jgi:hypothetical protein
MKLFKTALNNANTSDIIYSMAIIAPAAIKQAIKANLPEIIGLTGGDLKGDAILTGQWIRQNIKYKVDPFTDQNIQLPSALLRDKVGDCKSFSMLFLAIMEAAGYNGGFRFAGYRNKNFTHVYNYFLDNNNNVFTFDACIRGLIENKSYTKIKDMRINYIAGAPVMINENNKKNKMREVPLKLLMKDDRYASISGIGKKRKLFPKLPKFIEKAKGAIKKGADAIKKGPKFVKTVSMAPARGSFLALVNFNYKGLATKLNEALAKNPAKVTEMWVKFGGDTNALKRAIDKGKNKKAKAINGIGEEAAGGEGGVNTKDILEGVGAASGIISVVIKLFQSLGIGKGKKDPLKDDVDPEASIDPNIEPGEDFFANDPASPEAAKYATSGGAIKPKTLQAAANLSTFKPSPLLIGGAAAAVIGIYLLTKKKK